MRAMLCTRFDKDAPLTLAEIEPPALAPDGVRIRVAAAGVNFADTLLMAGRYQVKVEPPFSPGLEIAGTVVEAGREVATLKPGDRVMATLDYGGFAEEVVVRALDVHAIPDNMDFVTAAAFPVAYGTSHLGLTYRARLAAGETLVVHGAAGGVGLTAVECGKRLGARVIATAGGPDKLAVARAHGADELIDYRVEDVRERVKALTGGRGADVIYDPVGGEVFDASLRAAAPEARLLVIGFASGHVPQVPANILLVKNLSVLGFYWGAYRTLAPQRMRDSFAELFRWYEEGALRPHVPETHPLEDANAALDALRTRRSTGKLVLTVG